MNKTTVPGASPFRHVRPDFHWPQGRKCALSLCYDDGLAVHHELVAPLLDDLGLRATFYVPIYSDLFHHPEPWRKLAAAGHELGNHSLTHPNRITRGEGYEAYEALVKPWEDLQDFTAERLYKELALANFTLNLLDGQTQRTYGNCSCATTIGLGNDEVYMDPVLESLFVAARGPGNGRPADVKAGINLMQVGCAGIDFAGVDFALIMENLRALRAVEGWLAHMIHGVGPESHPFHLDPALHERYLRYLAREQDDIWVAPFIEVAQYVRQWLR